MDTFWILLEENPDLIPPLFPIKVSDLPSYENLSSNQYWEKFDYVKVVEQGEDFLDEFIILAESSNFNYGGVI